MKSGDTSNRLAFALTASLLIVSLTYPCTSITNKNDEITLPNPRLKGTISVEEAIKARRSIRSFQAKSLTLSQLSQILWAAQGITHEGGFKRAAPSAGALYPLEVFAVAGNNSIEGLKAGVYHYIPDSHSIALALTEDLREQIMNTALEQKFIAEAPLVIVITADYKRTAKKYGDRAPRYVHIEVGHVGENIMLQAISLGLSSAIVGAFYDYQLSSALQLPSELKPLLIIPIGYKK